MNNARRKQIKDIVKRLEVIKNDIESVLYEEQEAYDNMTEGLQCSEKGMNSEESIECLDAANDQVSDAIDNLNDIQ